MAIQSVETVLQPTPFIQEAAAMLRFGPMDILDLGCGTGKSAHYLAELGHRVLAMDNDIELLQQAQAATNPAIRYMAGDITQPPLAHGTRFDVVLVNEVTQHLPDRKAFIRSLDGLTKVGGLHMVSGYVGDKPGAFDPLELRSYYQHPDWLICHHDEDAELRAIRANGSFELQSLAKIIAYKNS